jgi:PKD repeat protein
MSSAVRRRFILGFLLGGALLAGGTLRADVIIPSSAFSTGKGNADFRTDVRIHNPTGLPVLVTPVFYRQANPAAGISAATITQGGFTIPERSQVVFDNIIGGLFNQPVGSFGPVRFQTTAPLVVSSGTNNYNGCGNGSVSGQWIPGLDLSLAAQAGALVQLATTPDSNLGVGYRTNVVFVNPGSKTANVIGTLRKGDSSFLALALFSLDGNGFKQIGDFKTDFAPPVSTTDSNLWLEFTSDQPIFAFASVINNASGDPFAVVAVPPPANDAFASIVVKTSDPTAGDPVDFGTSATNSPTSLTWSWGDGSPTETGSALARTHTYAAPGTYRVVLTVMNDAGGSTTAQDVVVKQTGGPPPPHY